jgi:hypothetical protein
MPEVLSDSPSLQEVLWNFCRFKDEKKRLSLQDNPHFYTELPTSPEAYGDSLKFDPTEDFRHANKFYVLTDRPELVRIMTDQDSRSFGNFWCPQNAVIFKGLRHFLLLFFFPISDVLPDIWGTLRGENIVKASLTGTNCRICKRFSVSTQRASRNCRGLQPIVTEGMSWMGWICSNGCLPTHRSEDMVLRVCTGQVAPDSPVNFDLITIQLRLLTPT